MPLRRVIILLLAAACGGGADQATSVSSTPSTPSPVTSPGFVYIRDDTTAYLADFLPTSGFAGAQVTLETSTATTSATGAFSVTGGGAVSRNFDALQATANGWMTTWFPWYTAEAAKPIPLALYPEGSVTSRPGFLKGVYYWDGGGLVAGFMRNGWTATTADRVRTVVNGNLMGALDELDVVTADTAANTVTMRRVSSAFSATTLQTFVNEAHSRGMKFIFELEINGSPATTLMSTVPASKTAFWDAYFAAWTPLLVQTTTMARDAGVDYFLVDGLKRYLSHLPIARMQTLMTALRATGFKGQLGYQGIHQGATINGNELASATPGFIDLFDFVSVYVASAVTPATGETLGREYSRKRIKSDVQTFINTVNGWDRPTIINGAVPSVHGGVSSTEYIEPCACANSIAPQRTRDYQQQADFYEAMAEVINASPTGKIIGLMSFGYMWGGDMTEDPNGPNSNYFDRSANVRGKPAESVLSWWFKRW